MTVSLEDRDVRLPRRLIQRHVWKVYRQSPGEQVKLYRERMKTRYDSGATDHHFKERDLVWMYNLKRRSGLSPKLQKNWEGPYTVVKKLNVVYRGQRSPNAKLKVIHINRLAPYRAIDHISM
ncbi:hypothetical protein AVEN_11462-1 [Araneus ventricosus]|uniref:Integrase p58-like C-terminal domain-containing protein n=1 Tax=Araneus ventricosus TaxID=182803 RepID=A0A4Y2RV81_ARAVE|nr:hypothetical protein AVEN_11462-1 [Araneus ventricosus]